MNKHSLSAEARRKTILSIVLGVICVIYVLPVLTVVINSFKLNTYVKTDTFALPNAESFAGWANFIKGLTFGNYPFLKSAGYSLFITIVSTALILLCTSMAAWYIARVDSKFCRMVYYLCVFSMVVPFQMVMFTLSKTADTLKLNTPWTIPIIYLGFGAGLAIFMFVGFIKSIPLEIEEAAAIDGCGQQILPHGLLSLRLFDGRAVPDGDVHTVEDGRYPQAQYPLDHPHHLPRLWRGACDFHVRRLYQIHPA